MLHWLTIQKAFYRAKAKLSRQSMPIDQFHPVSQLVLPSTDVHTPRFPVIDAHNHLAYPFGGGWDMKPLPKLLDQLAQANVVTYVDLDGGWGEGILQRHLDRFKEPAPEHFVMFGGVDWSKWPEKGNQFGEWAAGRLREQVRWGAQGLKIWKVLGLHVKDDQGNLARVDDARLDAIWQAAAELNIPVLIHTADPVAFFQPLDEHNEQWVTLRNNPNWHFQSPPYPPFLDLMAQFENLVARHPTTTFIGAHVGCYAENLGWVSAMLNNYPNYYIDISARIAELGRQPHTARRFFIDLADRILFGIDVGPSVPMYRSYYRLLETDDEYFSEDGQPHLSKGHWAIYGLSLPEDVLRKVYYTNAHRVLNLP